MLANDLRKITPISTNYTKETIRENGFDFRAHQMFQDELGKSY